MSAHDEYELRAKIQTTIRTYETLGDAAIDALVQHLTARDQSIKEQAVEKWKSFCGCPMCEHHSSAYELHSTNNSLEEKI